MSINNSCARHTHATATPTLPHPFLHPAWHCRPVFHLRFHWVPRKIDHQRTWRTWWTWHAIRKGTIDMCAAIKLSFDASRGREGQVGKEALPVKCKGAISRMFDGPNLAFVICVCVCVSPPLWIRIQIEVTNLNSPQNWLPLPLHLLRPWPLCCRLAKSDRKQGLATCLCTQCPYPLTSLSA